MKQEKLVERLARAIAKGEPFGPEDPKAPKERVKGKVLRSVLLAEPGGRSRGLWLRNIVVSGELNLEGCEIASRIGFSNCVFEGPLNANQSKVPELALLGCELPNGLTAIELESRWGVRLDGSRIQGVRLGGSTIKGNVSMRGASIASHPEGKSGGFSVSAASIEAHGFDCEDAILVGAVSLVGALIEGPLDFSKARLQTGPGSQSYVLSADGISVKGPVFMTEMEAGAEVRMLGAKISQQVSLDEAKITGELALLGGQLEAELSLNDATLSNPGGIALLADRLSVDGGVFCKGKFRADGDVRLPGAKIRSQLSLMGAEINGSLNLSGAKIDASLNLSRANLTHAEYAVMADRLTVKDQCFGADLKIAGEVHLSGAHLGSFVLTNAHLRNPGKVALLAQGIEIDSEMMLASECVVEGQIALPGAKIGAELSLRDIKVNGEVNLQDGSIGGEFALNGAKIQNDDGCCLRGERLNLSGTMFVRDAYESGEIRLGSATLEGLYIQDSTLKATKKGPRALHADSVQISGSFFCERTDVTGEVRFPGADIGSQLSFKESTLRTEAGTALGADRVHVGHGTYLDGITVQGEISFTNATLDGQFSTIGGTLANPGGNAIDLSAARIEELMLSVRSVQGEVNLRRADVVSLWDAEDGKPLWPDAGELRLEGLRYRVLREPLTYKQRLEWVEPGQGKDHYPGIYEELASNFRRIGRTGDARAVAIAGERKARKRLRFWSARGMWSDLLYVTIGYGYRNWLALLWLLALVGGGALVFCLGEGSFQPIVVKAPPLDPVLYAIDATVPVLDVGQQRTWAATGLMAWVSLALAASGYVLATAVVAAAAGLLSRDESSER